MKDQQTLTIKTSGLTKQYGQALSLMGWIFRSKRVNVMDC
ncbi:hypothetical protein A9E74_01658 [Methylophaga muralis]|uniref:Uncharacterized protein n=1 Tax=Methylophaga muralis TaxID=291169 RepID=A0A1E3GRM8_9GAMM|nr:hypothetical protein A9E74_01658 [Methylophaga muralis]